MTQHLGPTDNLWSHDEEIFWKEHDEITCNVLLFENATSTVMFKNV